MILFLSKPLSAARYGSPFIFFQSFLFWTREIWNKSINRISSKEIVNNNCLAICLLPCISRLREKIKSTGLNSGKYFLTAIRAPTCKFTYFISWIAQLQAVNYSSIWSRVICSGILFGIKNTGNSKSGIMSKVNFVYWVAIFDFPFNKNWEIVFIGK